MVLTPRTLFVLIFLFAFALSMLLSSLLLEEVGRDHPSGSGSAHESYPGAGAGGIGTASHVHVRSQLPSECLTVWEPLTAATTSVASASSEHEQGSLHHHPATGSHVNAETSASSKSNEGSAAERSSSSTTSASSTSSSSSELASQLLLPFTMLFAATEWQPTLHVTVLQQLGVIDVGSYSQAPLAAASPSSPAAAGSTGSSTAAAAAAGGGARSDASTSLRSRTQCPLSLQQLQGDTKVTLRVLPAASTSTVSAGTACQSEPSLCSHGAQDQQMMLVMTAVYPYYPAQGAPADAPYLGGVEVYSRSIAPFVNLLSDRHRQRAHDSTGQEYWFDRPEETASTAASSSPRSHIGGRAEHLSDDTYNSPLLGRKLVADATRRGPLSFRVDGDDWQLRFAHVLPGPVEQSHVITLPSSSSWCQQWLAASYRLDADDPVFVNNTDPSSCPRRFIRILSLCRSYQAASELDIVAAPRPLFKDGRAVRWYNESSVSSGGAVLDISISSSAGACVGSVTALTAVSCADEASHVSLHMDKRRFQSLCGSVAPEIRESTVMLVYALSEDRHVFRSLLVQLPTDVHMAPESTSEPQAPGGAAPLFLSPCLKGRVLGPKSVKPGALRQTLALQPLYTAAGSLLLAVERSKRPAIHSFDAPLKTRSQRADPILYTADLYGIAARASRAPTVVSSSAPTMDTSADTTSTLSADTAPTDTHQTAEALANGATSGSGQLPDASQVPSSEAQSIVELAPEVLVPSDQTPAPPEWRSMHSLLKASFASRHRIATSDGTAIPLVFGSHSADYLDHGAALNSSALHALVLGMMPFIFTVTESYSSSPVEIINMAQDASFAHGAMSTGSDLMVIVDDAGSLIVFQPDGALAAASSLVDIAGDLLTGVSSAHLARANREGAGATSEAGYPSSSSPKKRQPDWDIKAELPLPAELKHLKVLAVHIVTAPVMPNDAATAESNGIRNSDGPHTAPVSSASVAVVILSSGVVLAYDISTSMLDEDLLLRFLSEADLLDMIDNLVPWPLMIATMVSLTVLGCTLLSWRTISQSARLNRALQGRRVVAPAVPVPALHEAQPVRDNSAVAGRDDAGSDGSARSLSAARDGPAGMNVVPVMSSSPNVHAAARPSTAPLDHAYAPDVDALSTPMESVRRRVVSRSHSTSGGLDLHSAAGDRPTTTVSTYTSPSDATASLHEEGDREPMGSRDQQSFMTVGPSTSSLAFVRTSSTERSFPADAVAHTSASSHLDLTDRTVSVDSSRKGSEHESKM